MAGLTDVFETIRVTAADLFSGTGPVKEPKTCGVVRPCPCGDAHCRICEQVEYLGHGRWTLPDHFSVAPTQLSHGTQWQLFDAQGREHLLWVREG